MHHTYTHTSGHSRYSPLQFLYVSVHVPVKQSYRWERGLLEVSGPHTGPSAKLTAQAVSGGSRINSCNTQNTPLFEQTNYSLRLVP